MKKELKRKKKDRVHKFFKFHHVFFIFNKKCSQKKEEKKSRELTTEEMDDLSEDYRNLKKRLKGKMSEKELGIKMGI